MKMSPKAFVLLKTVRNVRFFCRIKEGILSDQEELTISQLIKRGEDVFSPTGNVFIYELRSEVQKFVKNYSGKTVLDDITMNIPKGRVFTLLGPNGSGKTTFLKILTGLVLPSKGRRFFAWV